jgi:hypothetical protein
MLVRLHFRLGASNGIGSTHKLDNKLEGPPLPNGSRVRLSPKNELEGPIRELAAGSNKERILTKGNNKYVFTCNMMHILICCLNHILFAGQILVMTIILLVAVK